MRTSTPSQKRRTQEKYARSQNNCRKTLAKPPQIVYNTYAFARLAQLVERLLDVERVSGSSPLSRTTKQPCNQRLLFLCPDDGLRLHKKTSGHKKIVRSTQGCLVVRRPPGKERTDFGQAKQAEILYAILLGPPCYARDNGLAPPCKHGGDLAVAKPHKTTAAPLRGLRHRFA